ncbi:MAG: NADPH:quinone oxidoreductase family protein [Panacagrimonas sp.]
MSNRSPHVALVCEHLSESLSGLRIVSRPAPELGPGEVRIVVAAAAVNFPDLLMARGAYQFKPPLPFVPGMEGAGPIVECGPDVTDWHVGDAVTFVMRHGAMAQEIVCPVDALTAAPTGLSLDEAGCHALNGLTAVVALERVTRLQAGETLLVHGARGGVGAACVQLGLHLGARVIASGSHVEALAALAAQGVEVVDVRTPFGDAVNGLTDGRGADVIADPVGGDVFDESTRCIAFGGRLLVLGFASGRIPTLAANRALIKGFSVMGVRAGEYGRRHPERGAENRERVRQLAAAGVLRPRIGLRLPLERAVEAFRALQSREIHGRIVLTPPAT